MLTKWIKIYMEHFTKKRKAKIILHIIAIQGILLSNIKITVLFQGEGTQATFDGK